MAIALTRYQISLLTILPLVGDHEIPQGRSHTLAIGCRVMFKSHVSIFSRWDHFPTSRTSPTTH